MKLKPYSAYGGRRRQRRHFFALPGHYRHPRFRESTWTENFGPPSNERKGRSLGKMESHGARSVRRLHPKPSSHRIIRRQAAWDRPPLSGLAAPRLV